MYLCIYSVSSYNSILLLCFDFMLKTKFLNPFPGNFRFTFSYIVRLCAEQIPSPIYNFVNEVVTRNIILLSKVELVERFVTGA